MQTVRSFRKVAFHLDKLKMDYRDQSWDARNVENYHESHFVLDIENRRVLDFKGAKIVSYAEVSSGIDNFTVYMRISGALLCFIEPAMVIYQINLRRYPILVWHRNMESVTDCNQEVGWIKNRSLNTSSSPTQ